MQQVKVFFLSVVLIICFSCNQNEKEENITGKIEQRDTTINVSNSFTELFFDSTSLENYIERYNIRDSTANRLRSFYNARNYQYAWFSNDGPAEQVYNFLNLQNEYVSYTRDSSLVNPILQQVFDTLENGGHAIPLADSNRLKAELTLTRQFFRYAAKEYTGSYGLNTNDLKWYIPRKKIDLIATLDSLIQHKGERTKSYEPINPYYKHLKEALIKYYAIEKNGGWEPIQTTKKKFQKGDTSVAITDIKRRLFLTGDFTMPDSSTLFTDTLVDAVKKFQYRYGLKADGIIAGATLQEMNQPIGKRIKQMLINLERMRWVPEEIKTDYLLVNIPEFKLHIFEEGRLKFNMNVVVGSGQHNTVIFSGDLKYVVFSPYWNVPPSIVRNEILPGIKKNKNYLANHNMEITGNTGGLPNVRQKPGANNSLGRVKFLFPNNYNIYMHDTPAKSLFGESKRAFSHGCIRLGEPKKLAEFLLRDDSTWTSEKITAAMKSGKERYVTLKKTVPVFIGYFTAWVDSKGELNFRDDVYGHDAKLEKQMFNK
ncbi:MAG: hypothetical protein BGP13_20965 [Sphingobacteriales bacterium 40-81]|nr:MAG: hypothetical protein BGP13_20965 [Sphingobacteriales bacterium 40-81]